MGIFKHLILLFASPHAMWEVIAAERIGNARLIGAWILPFSLLAAGAVTLGIAVFNREWDETFGYSLGPERAWDVGRTTLLTAMASTLVLAAVFRQLGGIYQSSRDFNAALKVAVFGTVPIWLVGALLFFMPMVVPGMFAFIYSCVLYGIGARTVLGVKERDINEFVGIALLFSAIALTALGMLAGAAGWM